MNVSELLATWFPLLLILAVWLVLSRRGSGRIAAAEQRARQVMSAQDELLAVNRQMAESLRTIEKLLEDRKS